MRKRLAAMEKKRGSANIAQSTSTAPPAPSGSGSGGKSAHKRSFQLQESLIKLRVWLLDDVKLEESVLDDYLDACDTGNCQTVELLAALSPSEMQSALGIKVGDAVRIKVPLLLTFLIYSLKIV
jgi:hypothetical protein